jgi:hypothetical protein
MPVGAIRRTDWRVFLSSTVRDLEAYRNGVKQALDVAQVPCYPSEDWTSSYRDVEARCREEFGKANAFLLLLGWWYGSELPDRHRTVTQEEFRWACERRWPNPQPPVAVLVPKEESDAETALRAQAEELKKTLADDAARGRHDQLVDAWRAQVLSWKTATKFRDLEDLRARVLTLLREWDVEALLEMARQAAAAAAGSDGPRLSDAQIGGLCRETQIDEIELARAEAGDVPGSPAVGLLVHGSEDAGYDVFLKRLVRLLRRSNCRGSLPPQGAGPELLVETIAQLLGVAVAGERTPQALAERVATELRRQPLGCIVEGCAVFGEGAGVAGLELVFWGPFHATLAAIHAAQPLPNRIVIVFADFSGRAVAWAADRTAPAGFDRLRVVTELGPFSRARLRKGLAALHVPEAAIGAIVDRAMKGQAGQDDPLPVRVIERLRGLPIEIEGDDA